MFNQVKPLCWVVMLVSSVMASSVTAAECRGESGEHQVALLELYTSEGCSSCPPADRWLSSLEQQVASQQVVPLALHVDYWNYLGWKDPYSKREYSDRQRDISDINRLRTIYTPQFVLNGRDLRGWYKQGGTDGAVEKINNEKARAKIHLTTSAADDNALLVKSSVELAQGQRASDYGLYLAVVENGLVSIVPRGENAGKTLHHDYVVRHLLGPYKLNGESSTRSESIAIDGAWKREQLGVAAFVQNPDTGEVLQALMVSNCS